jgi:hypothetical protein
VLEIIPTRLPMTHLESCRVLAGGCLRKGAAVLGRYLTAIGCVPFALAATVVRRGPRTSSDNEGISPLRRPASVGRKSRQAAKSVTHVSGTIWWSAPLGET